ncbi:MAG: hypothetical protein GF388_09230 [Candidatus Aegiribacteria sp.]|nr:hypothetical protein [Candidatus Aegiribacteria sp.]MBD3295239.1 hypothetical protein [Candidatus Fermentibacteria bacterium]
MTCRVVLVDACVLINLIHAERTDLLERLTEYDFRITVHVIEEITRKEQVTIVKELLERGILSLESITDLEVILDMENLMKRLDRGEASCVALACKTGWLVATDDGKAGQITKSCRNPAGIITTPGLLLKSIREGVISVEEADRIRETLKKHRFIMSFKSFRDLKVHHN